MHRPVSETVLGTFIGNEIPARMLAMV